MFSIVIFSAEFESSVYLAEKFGLRGQICINPRWLPCHMANYQVYQYLWRKTVVGAFYSIF